MSFEPIGVLNMDSPDEIPNQVLFEPDPTHLWWWDFETTGLDPEAGRILEIGLLTTTADLRPVVYLHSFCGPAPTEDEVATWPEPVQKMHRDSGLIDDMRACPSLGEIAEQDEFYARFLAGHCADQPATLAGSSVHFDRDWMKVHMPNTATHFHYRLGDVSAAMLLADRWLPGFRQVAEDFTEAKKAHRVYDDLQDSVNLAQFLRKVVCLGGNAFAAAQNGA